MPDNESYAAAQVHRLDPDRYLCAMIAPADRRDDLLALYAFNQEIAATREQVSEPMLGQIRLQWWREAIDGLYAGAPRRHQVIQPLGLAIERHGLDRALLDKLIDAREADLVDGPPPDLASLVSYAEGTSATLGALGLRVLGVDDPATLEAARAVGVAWALTGLLRALPFHARAKRVFLPEDLMRQKGVRIGDLFELRPSDSLAAAVAEIAAVAASHLAKARALKPAARRKAMPVLAQARLADAYLAQLRRQRWNALPPLPRPASLAWQVTWGALIGRY